jgi:hypothetical protein
VVTAEVPWLDSLLPEELDPLEDSLPLEDVLVDVSELMVGALELVDVSLAPEASLDADVFAATLFSVVFPVEAVEDWELGVVVVFLLERAGSCPEASCT